MFDFLLCGVPSSAVKAQMSNVIYLANVQPCKLSIFANKQFTSELTENETFLGFLVLHDVCVIDLFIYNKILIKVRLCI
jgi:hypothetical protein